MTTAGDIFKELDSGKFRPVYLIVGDEPFQATEILGRFKAFFSKTKESDDFLIETWDGEGMAFDDFRTSLEELPGLFSQGAQTRYIVCYRFERLAISLQEKLEDYFKNPNPDVCLVLWATKADKRKSWVKAIEANGALLVVEEPKFRDWAKWRGYMEKKIGKRLGAGAWERALEEASHTLSLVAADLERLATYVGDRLEITDADVKQFSCSGGMTDLFTFIDDVAQRKKETSFLRFHALIRSGEAELKLLSLLVRQFRLMDRLSSLMEQKVAESQWASELGVPPFALSKFKLALARQNQPPEVALRLISETDYLVKTGKASLFDAFLVPYFSA